MRLLAATLLGAAMTLAPAHSQDDAVRSWARVLEKFVDERGAVDFHALARERGDLDAFVAYVSRTSPRAAPQAFQSLEAKLAYYLNAYNALSMLNVIDSGFPERLTWLGRLEFFGVKRFSVGGERFSLYRLENDVIRPLGDERVHFALNCMSVSCPRLPREPFAEERLDRQLDAEARRFFSEPRNLQLVPEERRARVSSILEFYTADFLAKSPTLIAYINRYAAAPVPQDYRIEFIDYDWTVNDRRRF
jgi:Protein of unknown function, DUF547